MLSGFSSHFLSFCSATAEIFCQIDDSILSFNRERREFCQICSTVLTETGCCPGNFSSCSSLFLSKISKKFQRSLRQKKRAHSFKARCATLQAIFEAIPDLTLTQKTPLCPKREKRERQKQKFSLSLTQRRGTLFLSSLNTSGKSRFSIRIYPLFRTKKNHTSFEKCGQKNFF